MDTHGSIVFRCRAAAKHHSTELAPNYLLLPAPCCRVGPLQLDPVLLLPLLFKLFRVNDKQLRELLFRHIIAGELTVSSSSSSSSSSNSISASSSILAGFG
jgi:hypothetical protein